MSTKITSLVQCSADMKVFILAGGEGTRLWPYSNTSLPKQFLDFGAQQTLLQKTFARFAPFVGEENITVVTQHDYIDVVKKQMGPKVRVRCEPERRNTGPAIAWLVKDAIDEGYLLKDDLFFITPSDHYLTNEEELYTALTIGGEKARAGAICIFGISPRRPATGYGYIEARSAETLSSVHRFIEKPSEDVARHLIASNRVFWNAGMFLFHTQHFLDELEKYAPSLRLFIDGKEKFENLDKISIDYALMEHTSDAFVVKLNLTWSDVGTWDGVYEAADKDSAKNVVIGDALVENSTNCLVCSTGQKVLLSGIEDIMVLVSDDEVIVTDRNADVKALRQKLYSKV